MLPESRGRDLVASKPPVGGSVGGERGPVGIPFPNSVPHPLVNRTDVYEKVKTWGHSVSTVVVISVIG